MLLLSFYSYAFLFLIITIGAYYFFLKDDYKEWKKHRTFEGLKSDELVKLMAKLRRNSYMMIFEFTMVFLIMFVFMTFMTNILNINMPTYLTLTLISLYIISSQIYILKKRMRKSIEIFKTAKRTAR